MSLDSTLVVEGWYDAHRNDPSGATISGMVNCANWASLRQGQFCASWRPEGRSPALHVASGSAHLSTSAPPYAGGCYHGGTQPPGAAIALWGQSGTYVCSPHLLTNQHSDGIVEAVAPEFSGLVN